MSAGVTVDFTHSRVSSKVVSSLVKKLKPEVTAVSSVVKKGGYGDVRSSVNCCTDVDAISAVKKLVRMKLKLKPEYIVVVGIGGSNLGTIAIQEAVYGKLYNQTTSGVKILYADTTDPDSINEIITLITPVLKKKKTVILNAISKSGGTTETIANFDVLSRVLAKYDKNYADKVVITTGSDSNFKTYADAKGYATLSLPDTVGGRYSVYSSVGLFPLAMIGINLSQLLKGAEDMRKQCISLSQSNPAAISAASLFAHFQKGISINDTFLFSSDLESIGKWYRQLMGESIGKEHNLAGKRVFNGMTPTVSIGSTDLHSMAQLYLGGPYDKYTTFVEVGKFGSDFKIANTLDLDNLVKDVRGKSLSRIMSAILQGIQGAFVSGKRPFNRIVLPKKNAYAVGGLLQFKMIEMMYLGYLMKVNPFDQPNVEDYKIVTKKFLSLK